MPTRRRILHVGCGGDPFPDWAPEGEEVRLDINPDCNPDIVASMTDLGEIGKYDSVISCHALEHLYPHEVGVALKEFLRVLVPMGTAIIIVPDLEGVPPTEQVMYEVSGAQVRGLDMYYGYRPLLAEQPYMAHHTGFVSDTLKNAMLEAGFRHVVTRRLPNHQLFAVGVA